MTKDELIELCDEHAITIEDLLENISELENRLAAAGKVVEAAEKLQDRLYRYLSGTYGHWQENLRSALDAYHRAKEKP